MKSAIIYTRFSPRRNADDCESCETQEEICRSYCKTYGWNIIAVEHDKALSGASAANRPGLQKAVWLACKHRAILVVYAMSRLARNTKETIEIAEKLKQAKTDFASVSEKIDTTTAMGDAFYKIVAVLAELERKQTGERTSIAMRLYMQAGRRMGGKVPYGFAVDPEDPKRMIVDENEQKAIERIKQLRKYGHSWGVIADTLDDEGFRPRPHTTTFKGRTVQVKGKWCRQSLWRAFKHLDAENQAL